MVRRVRNFFNREVKGLHEAAYLLGAFAIISQVLALVRDRLFASAFGASQSLDVYYAAFRIPDMIFVIISALVSVSVLVPLLVKRQEVSTAHAKKVVDSIFTLLIVGSLTLVIVAFVWAEFFLSLIVPDLLNGEFGSELIGVTRVLLVQPFILSLSSLYSSVVQVYRKFFIYALSPVLYNAGIIFGVLYLYPNFGLKGLAYGVVLGACLHLLIQVPSVKSLSLMPVITFNLDWKALREVLVFSLPRTITLLNTHIILLIFFSLAGTMIIGSISVFSLAYNLQSVPLSIIGVSYSLAAFPTLSRLYTQGHTEEFLQHIVKAARHIIFWSIPVMVLFVVLRAQIVRVIFGAGEFNWNDTRLTAAALALFAISVVGQSLILLFVRGYYSAGQTKKPLLMSFTAVAVSVASAYVLINLFNTHSEFKYFMESMLRVSDIPGTVVLMLPLAYTIGQLVNVLLLWMSFDRQFKTFSDTLWKTMLHSLGASLIMGYVSFMSLQWLDDIFDLDTFTGIFLQGLVAGTIGIFAGVVILVLLDNREIQVVWKTMHSKIWKSKLVVVDQEEI